MATRTGSWEYGSGNGMRTILEVTRSSVYHTSTEVRYYVKIYTQNQYRYNDLQYLNLTGDLNGQVDYNNTSGSNSWGGGKVQRYSTTYTYTYGSGEYGSSPGRVTFGGRVSGAYNGVTPSVSGTWDIPARPYADPASPTDVVLTRPNTSRLELQWNRHATIGEPYTSQQVFAREFTGNSWGEWRYGATLTGGATSYVRTSGVDSNRLFQMRVRAQNSSGRSGWSYSDVVTTPPAEPPRVRAGLNSDGQSVWVKWENNAYDPPSSLGAVTFDVQRRPGTSGTWTTVKTGVAGVAWTDVSPEPGDNQYQTQAVSTVAPGSSSLFAESNVVSTIVPPLAPTNLSPDGGAFDLDNDVTLSWTHSDGGDGADQSHYSIEYSDDGGTSWTPLVTDVASTVTSHLLAGGTLANSATDYRWHVSTQGATIESFGPWSAPAVLVGHAAPVVTITTPGQEVNALPLSAAWTYVQAQGDAAIEFTISLYAEDGVTLLGSTTRPGSVTSYSFQYFVEDAETYVVEIVGQSSSGQLSAPARQAATIKLPVPRALDIDTVYNVMDGSMAVHAQARPDGGGPAPAMVTNLVTNPSAEVDSTGWTAGLGSNSVTRDTAMFYSGSASMKATWVSAEVTGGFLGFNVTGLTVGGAYTAGAWAYVPAGSSPVDLTAYFLSRANTPTTSTNQWLWVTHTFTADTATQNVGITNDEPTTAGQAAWIDSLIVVDGVTLDGFFDGDTKSLPTRQYSWTGAPHASTSVSQARGEVDPSSATIERRVTGGEWVTLARELPLPVDFVDPLPLTVGETEYRVTSVSEAPSYRVNDILVVNGPDGAPGAGWWGYLSYGDGFSSTVRVRGNLSLDPSGGRARGTQHFAGRRKPVALFGQSRTRTLTVGGDIVFLGDPERDDSTTDEWVKAGIDAGVVCWRDPTGRRVFAVLDGDVAVSASRQGLAALSFALTEVDYTESYREQ